MMWLTSVWSGFKRLFGLALAYPLQAAFIALLCLSAWLYCGKANALATITQMEQASKDARAAQIALNKAFTDKQTQIAKDADNADNDIIDRGRAYADSLRSKNYCIKANSAAANSASQGGDIASDTSIVLDRRDYDILVANTARLVDVKAWGDNLIAEGLAVPVE